MAIGDYDDNEHINFLTFNKKNPFEGLEAPQTIILLTCYINF